MNILTSRFGSVNVDPRRVITFDRGLLGFSTHREFALLQASDDERFFWLQSLTESALAFVVADPAAFFADYDVSLSDEAAEGLELENLADAQVLVVCNKVGDWVTGNMLGPLVINRKNQKAQQIVLTERRWGTRQPLMPLAPAAMPLAKVA